MILTKYRIISFDGGGVLGTKGITLLKRLVRENQESPKRDSVSPNPTIKNAI